MSPKTVALKYEVVKGAYLGGTRLPNSSRYGDVWGKVEIKAGAMEIGGASIGAEVRPALNPIQGTR